MSWDTSTPVGSEAASNGDNRIRELKTDLQTALRGNASDGTEAKFPGTDTANPVYRYRGLKGATGARPAAGDYGMYFDTTRSVLQRDNGTSWEDIGVAIPSGTVMVFYQASAPTGWTKVTTHNDKVLRVVSGSGGGSGGTIATSTSLAHSHTVDSHTHSVSGTTSGPTGTNSGGPGAGSADSVHTHTLSTTSGASAPGTDSQLAGALAYIDVICASKD